MRHGRADPLGGVHHAVGAQGHRLDAAAQGPESRRRIFGLLPGIGQPFADVVKLLLKEVVDPGASEQGPVPDRAGHRADPGVRHLGRDSARSRLVIADVDAGLLFVLALTSVGVYGVIIAGWASNSKYAFLGAMRSAAQIVAYEIAMGFALVGVLMAAGSLNLGDIVRQQQGGLVAGTGSGCSRCSSCISSRASRRPTARRSTSPKASRKSSPASTSSIRAWRSRCSSSPNTRT